MTGGGTSTSASAIGASAQASVVSVVAEGDDFRHYASDSNNSGATWGGWSLLDVPASEFFM